MPKSLRLSQKRRRERRDKIVIHIRRWNDKKSRSKYEIIIPAKNFHSVLVLLHVFVYKQVFLSDSAVFCFFSWLKWNVQKKASSFRVFFKCHVISCINKVAQYLPASISDTQKNEGNEWVTLENVVKCQPAASSAT